MTAAMTSGFGQFHTAERDPANPAKKITPYITTTLAQIRGLVDKPQAVDKAQAQWLIPSTLPSRSFAKQEAQGEFWMLWADFDENPKPLQEVADALIFDVLGNVNFEVYTSRSATAEKPKARVLIPLDKPLSGADWILAQEVFNDLLAGAGFTPDRVSERPAQLCYLPNRGAHYESLSERDQATFAPLKSWAKEITAKRQALLDQASALEAARKAAEGRRKAFSEARQASGRPGLIEAFNQAYTVHELLLRAGYKQRGNTFSHPASESGSYSASVRDGRVHSLSSSDPLFTDGAGAHDGFSVFTTLMHGGDQKAAMKDAGDNWLMIGGESWNRVTQREYMRDQDHGEPPEWHEPLDNDPPRLLKPVTVFDVHTRPSPAPVFVWDDYLPRGQVALLGAHGGTGKSTIALMLGVCAPLGRPLFGVSTQPCKVLFVSLEDGEHIVRHRLAHICRAWGIDPQDLHDRLIVVDGTEHPELFSAESRGAGDRTPTYFELRQLVQAEGIGLVIVDNASDAFGGDEIQRRQVRAFMRALAEVARATDCAVLLLAHVDKTTSRNKKAEGGEGYSGSTAWHNSARSRLFLTRGDDGLLTLEHQKANLGRRRDPVTLQWPENGLPGLVEAGAGFAGFAGFPGQQGRADDERAVSLLKLIAEFEGRGQYCSPATTSRNHVHALLRSEPAFQSLKLGTDATKRIVNQCQRAGWIEPLDYRSADRKPHQRWTVTQEGRTFAGLPAPTAPTAPTCHESADSADGTDASAPTAPTCIGGVGDRARTNEGAEVGAEEEAING